MLTARSSVLAVEQTRWDQTHLQEIREREQPSLGRVYAAVGLDCLTIIEAEPGAVYVLVYAVQILANLLLQVNLIGAGGHAERQLARRYIFRVEVVQRRCNDVLVHLALDLNAVSAMMQEAGAVKTHMPTAGRENGLLRAELDGGHLNDNLQAGVLEVFPESLCDLVGDGLEVHWLRKNGISYFPPLYSLELPVHLFLLTQGFALSIGGYSVLFFFVGHLEIFHIFWVI